MGVRRADYARSTGTQRAMSTVGYAARKAARLTSLHASHSHVPSGTQERSGLQPQSEVKLTLYKWSRHSRVCAARRNLKTLAHQIDMALQAEEQVRISYRNAERVRRAIDFV